MDAEIEKDLRKILQEPFTDGWTNTIDKKVKAITDLVVGTIPAEAKYCSNEYSNGHEGCRTEMLSRWTNKEKL